MMRRPVVYGINAVTEALRAGSARIVQVSTRAGGRVVELLRLAEERDVPVERMTPGELDRLARGGSHQGIAAEIRVQGRLDVGDLLPAAGDASALLVVLDSVEDPQNVGAILRTVDAAGAHGVVRQKRHSAPLDGATARTSAGAVAHVRVAEVVNIARALEVLKGAGVWTIGLAGEAKIPYHEIDLALPTALVVGAEGRGLRRLVSERCDRLVSIPMLGHVSSLNVSVATGIVLFEAVRQRYGRGFPGGIRERPIGNPRRVPGR